MTEYDVVVIGGGAAGLSAALTLGRSRRSVLVVDAGSPRNAPAEHVHNYLGREGAAPHELLAIGRDEVVAYGVEMVADTVTSVERSDGGKGRFELRLAGGRTARARRVLVATGVLDELPDVPGVHELWGRDVLHCPYCHGWEVRDQAIGILATSSLAAHQALLFRQLSADITVFWHSVPEPDLEVRERLSARGIAQVDGEVAGVESSGDRIAAVRTVSGERRPVDALVVASVPRARATMLEPLGVELSDHVVDGHVVATRVVADLRGETNVPGVWVAGNVAETHGTVIASAAAGTNAAAQINVDLIEEETRRAVDAVRAAA